MDRKSIITEKENIHTFLSNVSFNKMHYNLYNNILTRKIELDENILILLICQTAIQLGFDGYFDEFYIDITKRRHLYIKQILLNLRSAYLSFETLSSKFYKFFRPSKMSNREILFNRIIHTFDIDNYIVDIFIEENEQHKTKFISICNLILSHNQPTTSDNRVVPVNY
jgi:hypothetical protein